MALKDTLVRLKRQQEDAASLEAAKPRIRDEWISAVRHLVDEFKTFLTPFEADGSLIFKERTVSLTEETLGSYSIPAATIEAGPAKIELTPVGRVVVGAIGRVDLHRQGHASSAERILILRLHDGDPDNNHWMLRMPAGWDEPRKTSVGYRTIPDNYHFIPFSGDNVEKAIDFLLSL